VARCEVCGFEQYPANTRVWWDEGNIRHFACSDEHMNMIQRGDVPALPMEIIEETASEAGAALQEHQSGEEISEEAASEAARVLASAPKRKYTRKAKS
jgi:hypothetical protein